MNIDEYYNKALMMMEVLKVAKKAGPVNPQLEEEALAAMAEFANAKILQAWEPEVKH